MATSPDRLERITNLVLVLLSTNRPLSLREIGRDVAGYPDQQGAIRQAFERDKRTLRDAGIPIAVERIGGDEQLGYRIRPEDYYLPDLDLDPAERAALVLALVAVRLDGAAGNGVAQKLGAPASEANPIAVLPSLAALAPLQQAIRERAIVSFSFRHRRRSVEGYGLVFRGGSWYLAGRDTEVVGGSDLRTFRVDRIEDVPRVGPAAAYEVPDGFDLDEATRFSPFGQSDVAAPPGEFAELSVDVREADGVVALVGEAAVQSRSADGSVVVHFPIGDQESFLRWVLGLGEAVEVVGPPELRAATIAQLTKAAAAASS